ncbi:TPA: anaerobic ribonucleoside-triphosphate reductase activating protein [bacterium]|nr:anaerobic ribonucleoside-triphosphate reductase activating protein [bacterium]
MIIRGFLETSLLDFEGKVSSVLFVGGCNFRCPYCQNRGLVLNPERYEPIPQEDIDSYLRTHKDFIEGICLTGGEPCLCEDIEGFFRHFKEMGLSVKLDTNGSCPKVLRRLIEVGVVDYIAMDIKAPLNFESYSSSIGVKSRGLFEGVRESIKILMTSPIDYEFRTTVVPTLHTSKDIEEIAQSIRGAKRFILQNFQATETIDPAYSRVTPYTFKEIEEMAKGIRDYVEESKARGK